MSRWVNNERAVRRGGLCQREGFGGRRGGPDRPVDFEHLNLNTLKDERREGCFVEKGDIVHLTVMGVFDQMLMNIDV